MFVILTRKQLVGFFILITLIFSLLSYYFLWIPCSSPNEIIPENEVYEIVNHLFHLRNQAVLEGDVEALTSLYNRNSRYGIWAYEHQAKKLRYLQKWCFKQGANLGVIKSIIKLRRVSKWRDGIRVTLLASTEYHYSYSDQPKLTNLMRIGTYHSIDLSAKNEGWQICREWFTDPFADALEMGEKEVIVDRSFILAQKPKQDANLNHRRIKALMYADKYCGAAADDEVGFNYNSQYRNYNYSGGDCANFLSQVLFEGGQFRKTSAWNYGRGASRAWVNAHAFNRYMLNSGRASRIAYGTYNQVLRASYSLLPGDYIAYEKKGKVTHVSLVTGADSKGYTLTNSHNVDRYRVPWDLGYGDKGIRFWLVRVHY